jgi:hypothetical protein
MNILIFPSGSTVAQEIYDSLKYIKNIKIYGTDYDVSNYSSIYFENYISGCPFVKDEMKTLTFLKNVVIDNNIHYIFPAFDSVIEFLKINELALGVKVICPEIEIIQLCNSKLLTYNRLQNVIHTPIMYNKHNISEQDFPLYIKPITGYGTRNHSIIHNKTELENVDENSMLILELLTGYEFTVDCFTDFNGKLLYNQARQRIRTMNGISIHSKTVPLDITEIALKINKEIRMNGPWFFQVKYSKDNQIKLLEIACRIPGAMCVNRVRGINFSWLSILNLEHKNIEPLFYNDIPIECIKMFKNIYRTNFEYDNIYCDLDDTLILHDKVNVELIAFLFKSLNNNKKIHLITRNENPERVLEKYKVNIFNSIIKLTKIKDSSGIYIDKKSSYIKNDNSIFIDDSYVEKMDVKTVCNINCFSPSEIELL